MNPLILSLILALSLMATTGCAADPSPRKPRVSIDKHLGMSEAEVRKANGEPKRSAILRDREMTGEYHIRLKAQLESAGKPVVVKQLYYEKGARRLIFLLTEVNGVWVVASDADMPENVRF